MTGSKETREVTLLRKEHIAENTLAVELKVDADFTFHAGQNGDLTIPSLQESRTFSFASSPHNQGSFLFATRLTGSDYKKSLERLEVGSTLYLEGPQGRFLLPEADGIPVVFLVGGIGITPVRSMVEYALYIRDSRPITLFYSNKTPGEAAFLHELLQWSEEYGNLRVVPTVTNYEGGEWKYERGLIDAEFLERHGALDDSSLYYVVGPPGMASAMYNLLQERGVEKRRIRRESFTGY